MNTLGEHAVVIGGSIAGLMAARVLSGHFERVTVIERDSVAANAAERRGAPQAAHIHALLLAGERVLSSLYTGFAAGLQQAGAVPLRAGRDIAYFLPGGKAYSPGGAMKAPRDLGFDLYGASRALIEHCVREHTRRLPNVRLETATAHGLLCNGASIHGVRWEQAGRMGHLPTDLVVDAGGRGTRAAHWLAQLGFGPPPETVIGVDMAYASARFRLRDDDAEPERQLVFRGPAPTHRRSAILGRIEGGLWHLTLAGRFGEDPPFDDAGFRAFARSLHSPRLHQLIDGAERVGEIVQYQFPTSVRRHYEQLPALPQRWLAVGDAICSFNPIYGQGMSVAALQCQALQRLLAARASEFEAATALDGLAASFFALAAEPSQQAWTLAANQDFAFPQTRGTRPPGLAERARYAAALDSLIPEDPQVHRLLAEVVNLARPASALSDEPLRARVLERVRQQATLG
jgi:2-polyprenyl-6-methoxyphenol hydroxylase-like FAD-dependent oxidoreductase